MSPNAASERTVSIRRTPNVSNPGVRHAIARARAAENRRNRAGFPKGWSGSRTAYYEALIEGVA